MAAQELRSKPKEGCSGSTTFVNADRLGSTTHLTDATEATTDTREYDAYGQTISSTGSTATPFGFVGKAGYQQDADSGLMLLGHRYYDPSTGRFITRDPIKHGRNWYVYCDSNGTNRADPSGEDWWGYPNDGDVWNCAGDDQQVIIVGETYRGSGWRWIELQPLEHDPDGMDVDYVYVRNRKTSRLIWYRLEGGSFGGYDGVVKYGGGMITFHGQANPVSTENKDLGKLESGVGGVTRGGTIHGRKKPAYLPGLVDNVLHLVSKKIPSWLPGFFDDAWRLLPYPLG